jgi:hypothetical protein
MKPEAGITKAVTTSSSFIKNTSTWYKLWSFNQLIHSKASYTQSSSSLRTTPYLAVLRHWCMYSTTKLHRFSMDQQLTNLIVTRIQSKSYNVVFCILFCIILVTTLFYTIFIGTFKALRVFYTSARLWNVNTLTRNASDPLMVQRSMFDIFSATPDDGATEHWDLSGL